MMYFFYGLRGMNMVGSLFLLAPTRAFLVGQNWDKIPRHSTII